MCTKHTCLPNIKASSRFGMTGCTEIWFLGEKKGVSKQSGLPYWAWQNYLMPPFLKIRNINCVGLRFHIHVELLRHGCNVFPLFPWHAKQKALFLFCALSHSASATRTTFSGSCYCSVLQKFPWFPFYTFLRGRGRKRFLFLGAFRSLSPQRPIVGLGPYYQWK